MFPAQEVASKLIIISQYSHKQAALEYIREVAWDGSLTAGWDDIVNSQVGAKV